MRPSTLLTVTALTEPLSVDETRYVADVPTAKRLPSGSSSGASIEAYGIAKRFGERTVLSGVNIYVEAGELVAVIGTSGGGKTTLLRIFGGLTAPDEGSLQILHQGESADQVKVRIMFQEDRLLPWAHVLENVALALPKSERIHAENALRSVGLGDRARDLPHILSGGQRQRVALARALAHRPSLLLLDEPFGALDAITRGEMQVLVEELWQELGITILLVTHDIDEALRLADRVILLRDGHIAEDVLVRAPRPRSRSHPEILEYRERLEKALVNA
jgi:sulfonate transport system ATP-binding protein